MLLLLLSTIFFGYIIYKIYPWIKQKYNLLKVGWLLINGLNNQEQSQTMCKFAINQTNKSASIMYEYCGRKYIVSIPYDISHRSRMGFYKAELIYKNGERLLITQQAGIPYLVSAESLSAEAIEITDQNSGRAILYKGNSIPNYCLEFLS